MRAKLRWFKKIICTKEESRAIRILFVALTGSALFLLRLAESETPNPHYGPVLYHIGENYQHKGKAQAAVRYFDRAISADPRLVQAYDGLAFVYYQQKDYARALHYAQEAVTINPAFHQAFYHLGLIYRAKGNEKQAFRYLEKALGIYPLYPFSPVYTYELAMSLINMEDYREDLGNLIEDLKDMKEFERVKTLENIILEKHGSLPRSRRPR